VVRSWNDFVASADLIVALQTEVAANELALEGVRQEADVGTRTTLDVLDAVQELVASQVLLANARRNRVVFGYQLIASIGRLTAPELGLQVLRTTLTIETDLALIGKLADPTGSVAPESRKITLRCEISAPAPIACLAEPGCSSILQDAHPSALIDQPRHPGDDPSLPDLPCRCDLRHTCFDRALEHGSVVPVATYDDRDWKGTIARSNVVELRREPGNPGSARVEDLLRSVREGEPRSRIIRSTSRKDGRGEVSRSA
jgi:hypothetical protein